jgi:uncharacterized membrane protein (DUF4010 family)
MDTLTIFQDLGISLLLGLLVGLQRQHVESPLGGVRTFPLVTIFGTLSALLAANYGGWIVAVGFVGIIATFVVGKLTTVPRSTEQSGLTTAVALLLMYAVGAYVVQGDWSVAVAIGGATAILLQWKPELHGLASRLSDADFRAIMQFVLFSFVILPVLPDRTFGWYDVLNPREIWLMVVLVVGISLGGYVIWKLLGQKAGVILGGILGGTISSTATTVGFARRTQHAPDSIRLAVTVILISTAVSLVRVVVEVAVVARDFLTDAIVPMAILIAASLLLCVIGWFQVRQTTDSMPKQDNPTELKSALFFGFLYAVVLFAVAAAKEQFAHRGIFAVAVFSGLTDMDAITLSTSRLVSAGRLNADSGWRIIIVAAMANMVFKTAIVAVLGHRKLLIHTAVYNSILIAVAGTLLALLP